MSADQILTLSFQVGDAPVDIDTAVQQVEHVARKAFADHNKKFDPYERALVAWAQAKHPEASIQSVTIESGYDPGYSEYTPGEGYYCRVRSMCVGTRLALVDDIDPDDFGTFIRELVTTGAAS